jgi:hypothetical protein
VGSLHEEVRDSSRMIRNNLTVGREGEKTTGQRPGVNVKAQHEKRRGK